MVTKTSSSSGCGQLQTLYENGNVQIREIFRQDVPTGNGTDTHRVFFVEIVASLKQTPCQYPDLPQNTETSCFPIRSGVSHDGKVWDWYLMNCPHGPPCDFLESL
jgi:hypothetical protein